MSDRDRGSQCERREALENIQRNDRRARREANEAKAVRDRLEKQAVFGARADLGRVIAMAAVDAIASRPAEGTLDALRRAA